MPNCIIFDAGIHVLLLQLCLIAHAFFFADRFSPEFIEHRRRELERFLRRCANHQTLQHSEHVKAFLELSDEVWLELNKEMNEGGV